MKSEFKRNIATLKSKVNLKEEFKSRVSNPIVVDKFERDWKVICLHREHEGLRVLDLDQINIALLSKRVSNYLGL
jgi:hypothetical protein